MTVYIVSEHAVAVPAVLPLLPRVGAPADVCSNKTATPSDSALHRQSAAGVCGAHVQRHRRHQVQHGRSRHS